jgi:hypothetical protein
MSKKLNDIKYLEIKATKCLELAYNIGLKNKKAEKYAGDLMNYSDNELDAMLKKQNENFSKSSKFKTKLLIASLIYIFFIYFIIKI